MDIKEELMLDDGGYSLEYKQLKLFDGTCKTNDVVTLTRIEPCREDENEKLLSSPVEIETKTNIDYGDTASRRSLPRSCKTKIRSCRIKNAAKNCKSKIVKMPENKPGSEGRLSYRKILPAPIKPAILSSSSLLPMSMSSTGLIFTNAQNTATVSTPSGSACNVVSLPSELPQLKDASMLKNPVAASSSEVDSMAGGSRSILVLPTTGVVVLNSDMTTPTSIYTFPKITASADLSTSTPLTYYRSDTEMEMTDMSKIIEFTAATAKPKNPNVIPIMSKFRKIAPLVKCPATALICTPCLVCNRIFTDEEEFKFHLQTCRQTTSATGTRGKKKSDV